MQRVGEKGSLPPTPTILHECQNKGLTKFAIRKLSILKDAILVVLDQERPRRLPKKKKREQAPAVHM
jgi:hypothetical protein